MRTAQEQGLQPQCHAERRFNLRARAPGSLAGKARARLGARKLGNRMLCVPHNFHAPEWRVRQDRTEERAFIVSAYYNEIDPLKAEVLREAIKANAIAPGDVDERSITDVEPNELVGYTQCHFFAGGGFWSLAARLAGWPDSRTLWTGSCPCQPHSGAAAERKLGFLDPRDLWPTWFTLIKERRPECVFGEQVDDSSSWIDRMHADLESEDFAVGAVDFPACAVDAPHIRMRTYFVADTYEAGFGEQCRAFTMASQLISVERSSRRTRFGNHATPGELGKLRRHESGTPLMANGYPNRVGILRIAGDGIVVAAAQAFIESYMQARGIA